MHDDSPSQHALGPNELNEAVGNAAFGIALAVGFEVAEIADVALGVGGGAVLFAEGVDWERKEGVRGGCYGVRWERKSWCGIMGGGLLRTVRTSACAAVCVVAELMDVHAALGGGVAAVDVVGDGGGGGFGGLFEGYGTADGRVTAENCDC